MQNNLSNRLEAAREDLIKYCYFDNAPDADMCRALLIRQIQSSNNTPLILYFAMFFRKYIHVFFDVNRTKFNRLRAYFMRYVLASFILLRTEMYSINIEDAYIIWIDKCKMYNDAECIKVLSSITFIQDYDSFVSQLNSDKLSCNG